MKRPLPVGFVFAPKDEVIVGFYLKNLVTHGRPLPPSVHEHGVFIHDIDINGIRPPWEIAALLPEEERYNFYVFSKLKKLTAGRNRRTAEMGQGTWKGQAVGTRIVASEWGADVVGEKRMLSFLHGANKETSHWNMDEYNALEINGSPVLDDADGRWVICHVTHSKKKKTKISDQEVLGMNPNQLAAQADEPPLMTRLNWVGEQGPQYGAGQQFGTSESGNMVGANQNDESAGIGGVQQHQQLVVASEPHFGALQSGNIFDANRGLVSADVGGIQEHQPEQFFTDSQPTNTAREGDLEAILGQATMEDYQYLLYDPAVGVEAEKECLEQQFKAGDDGAAFF